MSNLNIIEMRDLIETEKTITFIDDDTFIDKTNPTSNQGGTKVLVAGKSTSVLLRAQLPRLKGRIIENIELCLFQYYKMDSASNWDGFEIYAIVEDWDRENLTWNNQPALRKNRIASSSFTDSEGKQCLKVDKSKYGTIRKWHGVMLKGNQNLFDGHERYFYSSRYTASTKGVSEEARHDIYHPHWVIESYEELHNIPPISPSSPPTPNPKVSPAPIAAQTKNPPFAPTNIPTHAPTNAPTNAPPNSPTNSPTKQRSNQRPTNIPTRFRMSSSMPTLYSDTSQSIGEIQPPRGQENYTINPIILSIYLISLSIMAILAAVYFRRRNSDKNREELYLTYLNQSGSAREKTFSNSILQSETYSNSQEKETFSESTSSIDDRRKNVTTPDNLFKWIDNVSLNNSRDEKICREIDEQIDKSAKLNRIYSASWVGVPRKERIERIENIPSDEESVTMKKEKGGKHATFVLGDLEQVERETNEKVNIVENSESIECSVQCDRSDKSSWDNGGSLMQSMTSVSSSSIPDKVDYCGALNPINVFSPRGRTAGFSNSMGSESESHELSKISSSSSYPSTITSAVSSGSSDKYKGNNIVSASDSATSSVRKVFS